MRPFRRYNWTFALFVLPVILGIGGLAASVDLGLGDLTRIGGYLEEDFGHQGLQEQFSEPQFVLSHDLRDYDRHYDVVVYGDSFSKNVDLGWQNWLVRMTNWSIITFAQDRVPLRELLKSRMFREQPPTLFLYEVVERAATERFRRMRQLPDSLPVGRARPDPLPVAERETDMVSVARPRGGEFGDRVGLAVRYSCYSVSRGLFGYNPGKAGELALTQRGLFSSADQDSTLILLADYWKLNVDDRAIAQAARGMERLIGLVENSGKTACQVVIFPDKLTVYDRYVAANRDRCPSVIPRLTRAGGTVIRLDEILTKLVDDGVRDVYLPSGTHCSSLGYRRSAEGIYRALVERGIARE